MFGDYNSFRTYYECVKVNTLVISRFSDGAVKSSRSRLARSPKNAAYLAVREILQESRVTQILDFYGAIKVIAS